MQNPPANPSANPASRADLTKDGADDGNAGLAAPNRVRARAARSSAMADPLLRTDIEEAEDWVVSYMDMVTLLMIVFLGMVAIMMIERKFDRVDVRDRGPAGPSQSGAPPSGIGGTPANNPIGSQPPRTIVVWPSRIGETEAGSAPLDPAQTDELSPLPGPKPAAGKPSAPQPLSRPDEPPLSPEGRRLLDNLLKSGLPKEIAFETTDRQIRIQISDKVLFSSGQAELSSDGSRVIRQLIPMIQSMGGVVSVEGHTDDVPIATARFPSNWELSAARAAAVVRVMADQGIAPSRLRAIGYADTRPVAAAPAGRSLNRRVTLVVEP
jgi:chemotaxis protein MotB